ncbi:hypothetical protein [Streptomyces sp. NPDC046712]
MSAATLVGIEAVGIGGVARLRTPVHTRHTRRPLRGVPALNENCG